MGAPDLGHYVRGGGFRRRRRWEILTFFRPCVVMAFCFEIVRAVIVITGRIT